MQCGSKHIIWPPNHATIHAPLHPLACPALLCCADPWIWTRFCPCSTALAHCPAVLCHAVDDCPLDMDEILPVLNYTGPLPCELGVVDGNGIVDSGLPSCEVHATKASQPKTGRVFVPNSTPHLSSPIPHLTPHMHTHEHFHRTRAAKWRR